MAVVGGLRPSATAQRRPRASKTLAIEETIRARKSVRPRFDRSRPAIAHRHQPVVPDTLGYTNGRAAPGELAFDDPPDLPLRAGQSGWAESASSSMRKGRALVAPLRSESVVMTTFAPGWRSGPTRSRNALSTWIRPAKLSLLDAASGSGKWTRTQPPSGAVPPCRTKTVVAATGPSIRTGAEPMAIPLRRTTTRWSAELITTETGPEAARSGCQSNAPCGLSTSSHASPPTGAMCGTAASSVTMTVIPRRVTP